MYEALKTQQEEQPLVSLSATVAVASSDGKVVDQHFGSARRFIVLSVSGDEVKELGDEQFRPEAQDGNEDKLAAKIGWLGSACADVVVCAQVGQSDVGQLLRAGIQPIAVDDGPAITEVVSQIQKELRTATAPWTRKLARDNEKDVRLAALLDEEWSE